MTVFSYLSTAVQTMHTYCTMIDEAQNAKHFFLPPPPPAPTPSLTSLFLSSSPSLSPLCERPSFNPYPLFLTQTFPVTTFFTTFPIHILISYYSFHSFSPRPYPNLSYPPSLHIYTVDTIPILPAVERQDSSKARQNFVI